MVGYDVRWLVDKTAGSHREGWLVNKTEGWHKGGKHEDQAPGLVWPSDRRAVEWVL